MPNGFAGMLAVQIESVHHRMPDRGGQWGMLVLVLAVVFLCAGTVPVVRTRRWRARAVAAKGRVIDHVGRPARRGRMAWLPVVEFEAEGSTVLFRSQGAGTRRSWALGQPVDVLYDGADPRRADLADAGAGIPWTLILGVAVLGVFIAEVAT